MSDTTEATIEGLAGEAYACFERATRDDDSSYVKLRDERPEWVYDLTYEAHGDMFPDDWRYACIRSALSWIHENDGDEEAHGFADSEVDTYTGARLEWAQNVGRLSYCADAQDEGLAGDNPDVATLLGLGQYMEASEVYGLVYQALESRLDEIGDES